MKASEKSNSSLHWGFKLLLGLYVLNSLLLLGAYLATHISPNSFSYIYFLGLAYPVLLLVEVLFGLFWILIRWKYALIAAFTLLVGWNHFRHFYAITWWQSELESPIKVMSFNVRIFNYYDLENREENKANILSFLLEESPDIICFQEFYSQKNPGFNTKDTLLETLEVEHYHERYTHELSQQRYFGVATFSKYPIINRGEIGFENDDNNYCIYSDVLVQKDTIRVFNAHLGSIRLQSDDYEFFGDTEHGKKYLQEQETGQRIVQRLKLAFEKRAIQAEQVALAIKNSPHPVVFCGDLNDTPVSYCYRQFNELLRDAFVECGNGIGQTYIGKVPSNRIDYIFHDPEMRSAHFTTHQVNYSDHKPISCEIQL